MKDALGHGSTAGVHAAGITTLPIKGGPIMSDSMWRESMPIANYTGQVQDMLGMWDGSQKPSPLSASETATINDAYAKRGNWRALARSLHDARGAKK